MSANLAPQDLFPAQNDEMGFDRHSCDQALSSRLRTKQNSLPEGSVPCRKHELFVQKCGGENMSQTSPQTNASHGQTLPIGTQLEEFIIERVLGSGGFGITYLARDKRLGRQVVIKENLPAQFCWRDTHALTVRPRHTEGEDADNYQYSLDSFEREASTLASLDNPGIVRVLRSFEAYGTAYFVMPFVEGTALDEQIRARQGRVQDFTEDELGGMLWRVLDALAYLHDRGIYHRDIKPGNILVTATGEPVLIDFGAARQRLSERSLTVIESAGYTPFEQLQTRGKVGPWSDIYALGGTLYKAITGDTPAKAADRIMDDPVVPLAERTDLRAQYSSRFLKSIDKAMAPKAADRFQDAGQWKDWVWKATSTATTTPLVEQAAASAPLRAAPDLPPQVAPVPRAKAEVARRKNHKALVEYTILAVVLLLVCGGAAAWWYGVEAPRQAQSASLAQVKAEPEDNKKQMPAQLERERLLREAEMKKRAAANDFNAAQIGDTRVVDLGGGVKLTLCYCPAGSFTMGSPASETDRSDDEDQVQVRITEGYWLAKTECTQAQWRAVMGKEPSYFKGDDLPVEQVSWEDAQEFMKNLNGKNVLPVGWKWSLPTEAQWEYACRAGTTGPYAGELERMAWYSDNSGSTTHAVGTKVANAWGLQDMHGNVYEWCSDWYDTKLPGGIDPTGASSGSYRVNRGGSWDYFGQLCRSAYRFRYDPGHRHCNYGFRAAIFQWKAEVVTDPAEKETQMTAQDEEAKQRSALSAAGKTAPFSNSLGMKFVPAGTPGVLFSVWETRVQDFTAFVEDSGHDAISDGSFGTPAYTLEKTADGKNAEWAQKGGSWQDPRFPSKQTGEHPVVCVSYLDAEAFCAWLTKKDRASGKIPASASYRLPTDAEWSRACGSSTYHWGESYPPKSSAGNYCGKEAMVGVYQGFESPLSKAGYRDSTARTAAVGMFEENRFGLCDMGGNVFEWCSTWYSASMNEADVLKEFPVLKDDKGGQTYRVLRGASWNDIAETLLRSSCRNNEDPRVRNSNYGFRCVVVVSGG
jgi:formylglycine-generating enzyme required for sulfatase activity/serine/threonine protein kinase